LILFSLSLSLSLFGWGSRAIMFHIGIATKHPPLPDPQELSELGIDFIRKSLTLDPVTRPSTVDLLSHPWMKHLAACLMEMNEDSEEFSGANPAAAAGSSSASGGNATQQQQQHLPPLNSNIPPAFDHHPGSLPAKLDALSLVPQKTALGSLPEVEESDA
jgi:serine/threonine protein kinase